ncbi:MAG TPA: hypothetical protein PLJ78_16705 [Anaerolineae bacterium]|nr:hypothetical protein [Anaerolineae bacterium]HQK15573.1 hypothetical protein [Anaerolineae bacterium]
MQPSNRFEIDELTPKFLDQPEHFNDWYFTVHFEHGGRPLLAKFSITEGNLLGQATHFTFSQDPLRLETEPDAVVLHRALNDIILAEENLPLEHSCTDDTVQVKMGSLTAFCQPQQQRIVFDKEGIKADLTFTPRGPILHWKHKAGAVCQVTDVTRVSGSESLSDVRGEITINGQTMPVVGRGLFEHVWFSALNFFEIRHMNWIYAHFDEFYMYICHCESITSESRPFHFETGEMYMVINDEFMPADSLEVTPEQWVFLQEARRFIPLENSVVVRAAQGTLRLKVRLAHYPLILRPPTRLEGLTVDNVPGWQSLFFDGPVTLEGKFTYKDGRVVPLKGGVGINEVIRMGAL